MRKNIFYVGLLTVALWSCSKDDHADQDEVIETIDGTISINTDDVSKGTIEGKVETGYDADDLLENSTFSSTVRITYGSSVTIDNPLEGKGVSVAVSGNDVTVTATVSEVA
jgi:uncharacterized cupin superfamily protein